MFTGKHCEINIDDCANNPCVNGDCEDLVAKYVCHCYAGFTGANCQISKSLIDLLFLIGIHSSISLFIYSFVYLCIHSFITHWLTHSFICVCIKLTNAFILLSIQKTFNHESPTPFLLLQTSRNVCCTRLLATNTADASTKSTATLASVTPTGPVSKANRSNQFFLIILNIIIPSSLVL